MRSASRESFRALLAQLREISDEWIGPERGVAHRDPGLKNWLDTAGRPRGTIYWRQMLPEQAPEVATCRVVSFDEVATGGPNAKREESR